MRIRQFLFSAAVGLVAVPAWPCSVIEPLPSPGTLVQQSEVILRVRADAVRPSPDASPRLDGAPTQIDFRVLEVLKGDFTARTVSFDGLVSERDDHNDRPVPYEFVRPAGRRGNCYALEYRLGAEYLLLLRPTNSEGSSKLTPYWSALAPSNEQLFDGTSDPWYRWVRRELGGAAPDRLLQPASGGR